MHITNERSALLQAIIRNPNDDLPRLVYADWLEESSEYKRAEFIRLQCEISNGNSTCLKKQALTKKERRCKKKVKRPFPRLYCRCRSCRLARRADDLNANNRWKWMEDEGITLPLERWNEIARGSAMLEENSMPQVAQSLMQIKFFGGLKWRRGFLHSITLPIEAFFELGKNIARLHPIKYFLLTNCKPCRLPRHDAPNYEYRWYEESDDSLPILASRSCVLPAPLFGLLKNGSLSGDRTYRWFAKRPDATNDLIEACRIWANE